MFSPTNFVHLRLHSEFDIRKGVARLSGGDSVVAAAAAMRQPALALTDTDCLFGAVKFYQHCLTHGVKPLIGCEIRTDSKKQFHLLLLCASTEGYINLSRLLSRAHIDGEYLSPTQLEANATAGIIALSGARRGHLANFLRLGQEDRALKMARDLAACFPDRLYLEVWRARPEDEALTAATLHIADIAGLPVVATHPVQCTRAEDAEMLTARLCIAHGRQIGDPTLPQPLAEQPYLLTAAEMTEKFADLPETLENSAEIAKRCNFTFDLDKKHLPSLPETKSDEDSMAMLQRLAQEGLEKKLPAALSTKQRTIYDERLHYELTTIGKTGFADYFLIVTDFIGWAKREGIPVGPGRGSGAGSLVAYALDITTLNPIEHGLLFERFLNPERVSLPDFDVDFCVEGRERVIRYVEEKYGGENVSQIVTFGAIGAKGSVRDVGRILGMPFKYVDGVARLVPGGVNVTLEQAFQDAPALAQERKDENGNGKRLLDLAVKVEGLPRNIGTHAGGVLITPRPVEEFCPRYLAADTQTPVSQLDMVDIEKIGLVKFDFLGLRMLTILDHAERHLKQTKMVDDDFSLETIPLDDKKAYRLYTRGDTIGIFQCESSGMRDLTQRLCPDRFEDIVALMALYRPGPLDAGADTSYIKRKHGKETIEYAHDDLEPALRETYGVVVYQEQVMEIARIIAGYTLSEADLLRRAMGKKKPEEMKAQKDRFIDGAKSKLSPPAAQRLFDDIEKFAGYGFNKSHAAAYAIISYRSAYLKAHYPAAFLAAMMSAECGDTERMRILAQYTRQLKLTILGPDVNRSDTKFYAVDKKTISYGLAAVKGIGVTAADDIVQARGKQPFRHLFDFCARTSECQNLRPALVETLVYAGAFDSLHPNRAAVKMTLASATAQTTNSGDLFGGNDDTPALANAAEWTLREKLDYECNALGFTFSDSFYRLYENFLEQLPLSHPRLSGLHAGEKIIVAGLINNIRENKKMREKGFGIITIYDDENEAEVRVKSNRLQALRRAVSEVELLVIEGVAQRKFRGVTSITADHVYLLDDYLAQRLRRLVLHCEPLISLPELHKMLPSLPPAKDDWRPGCEIILHYRDERLACALTLGQGWEVGMLAYRRLEEFEGVSAVNAIF